MNNNNNINTSDKLIPVCCYARYSSHNQHESSIEAQLSEIYKYAERNNMNIVATYIDRARTGKNDNRPEFKKMMNDAKNAPPKVTRVVNASSHLRPVEFTTIRFCKSDNDLLTRCRLAPCTNIRNTSNPPRRAIRHHQ